MLKLAASNIVTNAVNGNRSTTATDVWSAGDSLSTTYEGIYDIDLSVAPLGNLTQVLLDTAATPQGPAADSSFDAASAAALNASIPALGLGGVAAITQVYKTTVKTTILSWTSRSTCNGSGNIKLAWIFTILGKYYRWSVSRRRYCDDYH